MKKIFLLLLFLSGCMVAPQKAFQVDPDSEIFSVNVQAVEVVPMATHFDMLPHVENKLPTSPEQAVVEWAQKHLKSSQTGSKKIWIVVNQAEMLKTELPADSFFQMDEESYTLNYQLSVQVRQENTLLQTLPVEGKGVVTLKKRASLASKEKGWAWLIQKMLTHLKTKMKSDLKDVFSE